MKKSTLLIWATLAAPIPIDGAIGATCQATVGCQENSCCGAGANRNKCATYGTTCYNMTGISGLTMSATCTSCNASRKLVQHTINTMDCTIYYNECECSNGCTDSTTTPATGYTKTTTCDINCKATTTYSCASGYYGTATSNLTGCTKCPTATDANRQSCANGKLCCKQNYYPDSAGKCVKCPPLPSKSGSSTSATTASPNCDGITGCYMQTGSYVDDTGMFTITDKCYYKNS